MSPCSSLNFTASSSETSIGSRSWGKYNLLIETLPLGVVTLENVGFYVVDSEIACSIKGVSITLPIKQMPKCARILASYLTLTSLSSAGSPDLASTQPTWSGESCWEVCSQNAHNPGHLNASFNREQLPSPCGFESYPKV